MRKENAAAAAFLPQERFAFQILRTNSLYICYALGHLKISDINQ